MPQPAGKQFVFADSKERERLRNKVQSDWSKDSADMGPRANALRRWIRLAEGASVEKSPPDQDASNFHIPLVLWQILAVIAKELSILFGEDADIIVTPVGKTDAKRKGKIKRWMKYRVRQLGLFKKYYDFSFEKNTLGTAIAHLPYKIKKRLVKKLVPRQETTKEEREVNGLPAVVPVTRTAFDEVEEEITESEGLDFVLESIEDWAVPKGGTNLEDLHHFSRRIRLSMDDIFDLRDEGKLDPKILTEDVIEKLERMADTGRLEDGGGPDPGLRVREERRSQSGEESKSGGDNKVAFVNWFGKFRIKGQERSEQLVVFFQQDLNEMLGVSRLVDIFPDGKLPFLKSDSTRRPKSFWGKGKAELLEPINNEMDAWHNIITDAGELAVGPPIGYKPLSGVNPQSFTYSPRTFIPLNDPKNDMAAVPVGQLNIQPYAVLMPQLLAMAERITGLTESQLGRQFSGPNAPRTASQQFLLQGESNTRLFLDMQLERETFKELMHRIWEADKRWLPKPIFFRVTEESPDDVMEPQDFEGDFDFDIGPPTSVSNRSQQINEMMQAYAITLQNPIAQQNPVLLAEFLKKILDKLHFPDLANLVPDTEKLRPPQSAEDENVRMLQGEDVDPHPADNHNQHIAKHTDLKVRIQQSEKAVPGITAMLSQAGIFGRIDSHIAEHQQAMKTQGGSINVQGLATQQSPNGEVSGPTPEIPGAQQFNPGGNSAQAGLASILNQGGTNLG